MSIKVTNLIRNILKNEKVINLYYDGLSIALPVGTVSGIVLGLSHCNNDNKINFFYINLL